MATPHSLLVFVILIGTTYAFVYSCNEVKSKINTDFEAATDSACLVLEETFKYEAALQRMYLTSGDFSISFAELAQIQCVILYDKPWKITANSSEALNLNCWSESYGEELTLIFSSIGANLNIVKFSEVQNVAFNGEQQVFVYPRTGIWLHNRGCDGNGNVSIYTGAGTGEEEKRFLMKSWRCAELPDWIIAFDNVVTVILDNVKMLTLEYVYPADYYSLPISTQDKRVTIMLSGKSDNLQALYPYLNFVQFERSEETIVRASCDPCEFDPKFEGYLRLSTSEYFNGPQSETHNSTFDSTFIFDFYFYVQFIPRSEGYMSYEDIGESQDNFVLDLTFGEADATTPVMKTDAPLLTTPKQVPAGEDPYCQCTLDKKFGQPIDWDPAQIWIDVVIILDTSESMGEQGLIDAITLLKSFFGTDDEDVLNTNTKSDFYTRVGLISMADKPTVLFNLNMTKKDTVGGKVTQGLINIDVVAAFNAAQEMLMNANPQRPNTRQVIYYMTNSNPPTIPDTINQFKAEKGKIIVNNFVENGAERPGLKNLASDGYFYSDIQYNYMASIQLFCKANCYCLAGKESYPGQNTDPAVSAFGGCFHAVPAGTQYSNAKANCANGAGLIVSVHDMNKAQFLNGLMNPKAHSSDYYWIGYAKNDAGWKWEDQSTNPWTNWDANEPSTASVAKCTYVDSTTPDLKWGAANCNVGFPFACEYAPCSVGNKNC